MGLFEIPSDARRGKAPCGECHLNAGETCDICGARKESEAEKIKRLIVANEESHQAFLAANARADRAETSLATEQENVAVMAEQLKQKAAHIEHLKETNQRLRSELDFKRRHRRDG